MGHFLTRAYVNERLRLKGATSYRIVSSSGYGNRINSDRILAFLNSPAVRRGVPETDFLPCDLMTAEEFAASPELAESAITPHDLLVWSKRKRDPIPHYRINWHSRRYPRKACLEWMERKFR